jgi:hypothetical protein
MFKDLWGDHDYVSQPNTKKRLVKADKEVQKVIMDELFI